MMDIIAVLRAHDRPLKFLQRFRLVEVGKSIARQFVYGPGGQGRTAKRHAPQHKPGDSISVTRSRRRTIGYLRNVVVADAKWMILSAGRLRSRQRTVSLVGPLPALGVSGRNARLVRSKACLAEQQIRMRLAHKQRRNPDPQSQMVLRGRMQDCLLALVQSMQG